LQENLQAGRTTKHWRASRIGAGQACAQARRQRNPRM